METHTMHKNSGSGKMDDARNMQYKRLIWMVVISFIAMYILMYSMVDKLANVIPNFNQFYMAGLMTASMIIIEIMLMGGMYTNKKLNAFIIAISALVLVVFFLFIRNETGISDKQFLKSMIPHHGAAILMVEKANLKDPQVKKLASDIISSQSEQIDFMKAKIKELDNK